MKDDTVKLGPIIRDNFSWNSELTYDVFLKEFGDVFVFDTDIGFCFNPFAELVVCNEQNLFCVAPVDKGLTMSTLYCINDQGLATKLRVSEGTRGMGACH